MGQTSGRNSRRNGIPRISGFTRRFPRAHLGIDGRFLGNVGHLLFGFDLKLAPCFLE